MGVLLPPLPLPAFIPALGCIRLLSTLIQQNKQTACNGVNTPKKLLEYGSMGENGGELLG